MLHGEVYARAINASWFAPTCGTVAKEVLRKHFEIPACKACSVTESSPGLEAAGFVDMQNCVFGKEGEALEKMEYLFEHPQELERIILAGYELVHSRHTLKQRDQILQWFTLRKQLKPGERIVQASPFGPLAVRQKASATDNSVIIPSGAHLRLLRQGDSMLWSGSYEEAEALYRKASNYIHWMPEPTFRLALCRLYRGDARTAHASISRLSHTCSRVIEPLTRTQSSGPIPLSRSFASETWRQPPSVRGDSRGCATPSLTALAGRLGAGNCSGSGAGVSPAARASRPRIRQRGRDARYGRRDARPTT